MVPSLQKGILDIGVNHWDLNNGTQVDTSSVESQSEGFIWRFPTKDLDDTSQHLNDERQNSDWTISGTQSYNEKQ